MPVENSSRNSSFSKEESIVNERTRLRLAVINNIVDEIMAKSESSIKYRSSDMSDEVAAINKEILTFNEKIVLDFIKERDLTPSSVIALYSSLSLPAINNIINNLINKKLIERITLNDGSTVLITIKKQVTKPSIKDKLKAKHRALMDELLELEEIIKIIPD